MFRFYSRNQGGARVTLVGNHSDGVLRIAASRCSNKDTFSRKKGVEEAERRMNKRKFVYEEEIPEVDARAFIDRAKVVAEVVLRTKGVTPK